MPSLRERLAMAKSRSPISSSARLAASAIARQRVSAARPLPLRSSRSRRWCCPSRSRRRRRACRSCRRAAATAGPWARCRASCAARPSRRAPAPSASSTAASAASADGARSFDAASCTRPSSWNTCGCRRTSFSTTWRSESSTVNSPGLGRDLREEDAFEDVIADLFPRASHVAALDRVDHLVRLFEHERRQRLERLLAIPRTAVRRSQRAHDRDELVELCAGVRHSSPFVGFVGTW